MAKTMEQKLLTNFNQITGLLLRGSNSNNINKLANLRSMYHDDDDMIRNFMEDWYEEHPTPNADTAMMHFYGYAMRLCGKAVPKHKTWVNGKRTVETPKATPIPETPEAPKEERKVEETPKPTANAETQAAGFLTQLGDLLVNTVAKEKTDEIVETVKKEAVTAVEQFVHDTYGELPKKVVVHVDDTVREVHGITHEMFETALYAVRNGRNVMLVGGAGSGKNVLCEQIAEALGLPFYFSNAVTQEYKITGFTDANGVYQPTPFYKAWTGGGLFMLDEVDASIADVLVMLNAAISNGYADFPAPIGNVKKHKDFHLMAAGNTYGYGADYEYVGRNVIDAATRNRFIVLPIDYSPRIEEEKAAGDTSLLVFCRNFRAACAKTGVKAIVSYRNIENMSVMSKMPNIKLPDVIDYCLTTGMRLDDLNTIWSVVQHSGTTWHNAFSELIEMKRRATA